MQQALFAMLDSLAKIVLTRLPELVGEPKEAAVAKAQSRYARLPSAEVKRAYHPWELIP
jgi:hypothetical protein